MTRSPAFRDVIALGSVTIIVKTAQLSKSNQTLLAHDHVLNQYWHLWDAKASL